MNKRLAIIFLSLAVGIVCLVLLTGRNSQLRDKENTPVRAETGATSETNLGIVSTNLASEEWQRPSGVDDAGWAYMLKVRKMMLGANQPIEFYARVIDQAGNPVAGARLDLKLSYVDETKVASKDFIHMKMGSEIARKTIVISSDEQGRMQLTGVKGHILDICGLSKEGYLSDLPEGTFDSLIFDPNGKRRSSVRLEMMNALDASKGYTFHLWKNNGAEKLVPTNLNVDMNVMANDEWVSNYFVSFIPSRVEWTNFPGVDLIIQGERRQSGNADRPFEFTFELVVVGGGMQVSGDAYPYAAPLAGYQSSWSFENKPQQNPPDFPWSKKIYFRLRGGKIFAGGQMDFCKNGSFGLSFNGYLNPFGSPNLEPDPEKVISDPDEVRRLDEATRVR